MHRIEHRESSDGAADLFAPTHKLKVKDGGAMSAKILGSDSELNMWVPEQNQGLVIINVPQSAIDNKAEILNGQEEP